MALVLRMELADHLDMATEPEIIIQLKQNTALVLEMEVQAVLDVAKVMVQVQDMVMALEWGRLTGVVTVTVMDCIPVMVPATAMDTAKKVFS